MKKTKDIIPITEFCDSGEEFTTPEKFAEHCPECFKEAGRVKAKGIKHCYLIFLDNAEKNKFLKKLKVVFNFHSGSITTKVFEYKNALIAISPLGGPSAASLMEELTLFGITNFIAIGSAGCLDDSVSDKFLLVDKAIRDEGLSYHYLKPSTYVSTNKDLTKQLEFYLEDKNYPYTKGITWTNDAFYRETKNKIDMAKSLGAVAVEMECASWCAVAKYRKLKFAQILYFSDIVKQENWQRLTKNTKGYSNSTQDKVVLLVKDMIDNLKV